MADSVPQPPRPVPAPAPAPAPAAQRPLGTLPPMEMVRLSHLFHQMAHHPQTRGPLADLVARVDPNSARAFSDVLLDRKFAALEKKIDDKEMQGQIDRAVRYQQAEKQQLIDSGRYTPEQITDIEKLMTAKGYHSYKDGAVLWGAEHPPPPPAPPDAQSATWEFPSVIGRDGKLMPFDDFKKDAKKASWNAAYRVIDEFKLKTLPPTFTRAA